jgi:hypothetical protein
MFSVTYQRHKCLDIVPLFCFQIFVQSISALPSNLCLCLQNGHLTSGLSDYNFVYISKVYDDGV